MAKRVNKPYRVFVLGGRGIPEVPGGVETHCQELYPRMVRDKDFDITVLGRSPYLQKKKYIYEGVKVKALFAPKKNSLEAIIHSIIAVLYAKIHRADLLHVHAIGPSLVLPLARFLGLKVIVTHHGPDYDRQKWGKIAKALLKKGESYAVRYANKIIVISNVIKNILKEKHNCDNTCLVYNGVNTPEISDSDDYLKKLGLNRSEYIIGVGRFVEEKGFHDLIKAYSTLEISYKLVLVGDTDHPSDYSKKLKDEARKQGCVLTGYIRGEQLKQIFSHARLFVMPSYHEGLPIALLEALSYRLDVLVSDIPANNEVGLTKESYFTTGNTDALAKGLSDKLLTKEKDETNFDLLKKYNWDEIAIKTAGLYKKTFREEKLQS